MTAYTAFSDANTTKKADMRASIRDLAALAGIGITAYASTSNIAVASAFITAAIFRGYSAYKSYRRNSRLEQKWRDAAKQAESDELRNQVRVMLPKDVDIDLKKLPTNTFIMFSDTGSKVAFLPSNMATLPKETILSLFPEGSEITGRTENTSYYSYDPTANSKPTVARETLADAYRPHL